MDYTITFLAGAVASLLRPQTGLLDMFFPNVQQSTATEIKFDTLDGKRRISPFVSPLIEGRLVESLGQKTNTFTPAYVKDKRVLRPKDALKRAAGEKIGGSLTPDQRRMLLLKQELTDQIDMLTRRQEVMASEVLRTGKVTVEGEGFDTVVVDFGERMIRKTSERQARWLIASGVRTWRTYFNEPQNKSGLFIGLGTVDCDEEDNPELVQEPTAECLATAMLEERRPLVCLALLNSSATSHIAQLAGITGENMSFSPLLSAGLNA
ncbi:MAG: major capsid protein, partial [Gammaproteobacteria bacterium]|nr:major capsid protein [Gammaproteobacteria bacterium]